MLKKIKYVLSLVLVILLVSCSGAHYDYDYDEKEYGEEYEGLKRQYESIMQRLESINNVADVEQPKSKSRKGTGNEQPDI